MGSPLAESASRSEATPADDRATTAANAFRAALTLGGFWTVANRLSPDGRRSRAVYLARLASLAWLATAVGTVHWWYAFEFGAKEDLRTDDLNGLTFGFVLASMASLALSLPLARRAGDLLSDADPARQRRQAGFGTGAVLAVMAAVAFTAAEYNNAAGAISAVRDEKRRAQEDAFFLGSPERRIAPSERRAGP